MKPITPNELELAKIKKDLYIGVLASGSQNQREAALAISEGVYQWCINHIGQVEETPKIKIPEVRTTAKATRE
jgi:hypothetical protein